MSILDRALNTLGLYSQKQFSMIVEEAVKRELDKVHGWLGETADAQKYDMPNPAIFANQADLYRLSPILGTALDIVAGDIGTSTFNVKRVRSEEEVDIPNHELEMLLRTPNPMDSGIELMQYTTSNYKLNGNSVWWLNRADPYAKPDEIWTIPFSKIEPVPDGRLYLSHYNYFPGNAKEPIRMETWEIVHFKTYNPNNPFVGLSPMESLAVTLRGDLAMRATNTVNYAEHGGAPQSILAFKDFVPNESWEDIKAEKRLAAKRNEMMMLRGVGDGISWLQRALSNKDMDYIAGLKQNMTDIFNRICPGLLSMLSENATEANALAARATYSEKTLWIMMEVIAQKVTSDILPAYGLKLRGHFTDPRVVDRKLQLEEQSAFERTHTLEEVRQEYYQDDPLGDERDKLLVSQVKAESGGIQKPPPSPFNNQPKQLTDGEEIIDAPAEEIVLQDTGAEDVSAKAAIDDLLKWRKMALRGKTDKALEFESNRIPAFTMQSIKARLKVVTDKGAIAGMFDRAIEAHKPKPQIDPLYILQSIEAGVRALEAVRK
jgi:hypothetical protein